MPLRLLLYIISRCAMLAHAMAGFRVRQATRVRNTRILYYVLFYLGRQKKVLKASKKYGTVATLYTRIRQIIILYGTVRCRTIYKYKWRLTLAASDRGAGVNPLLPQELQDASPPPRVGRWTLR